MVVRGDLADALIKKLLKKKKKIRREGLHLDTLLKGNTAGGVERVLTNMLSLHVSFTAWIKCREAASK